MNPLQPNSSACIGCHASAASSSHALANTTTIGESCAVHHGSGAAFAVDKMHAQYSPMPVLSNKSRITGSDGPGGEANLYDYYLD